MKFYEFIFFEIHVILLEEIREFIHDNIEKKIHCLHVKRHIKKGNILH